MMDCCPLCGQGQGFCCHGGGGCPFAADNPAEEARTIVDEWATVPVPPAPALQPVTVDPETSALLILDMETTICNGPRCLASIARISELLVKARRSGMLVVYSLTRDGSPADIARELTPAPCEPLVRSSVDKFYKTALQAILRDHGIRTVVVTGYAANGAVLHTAAAAAFRGYRVIVPVDGVSANEPYAEQYTAWHMLNSPGTRNRAILSATGLISIQGSF